MRFVLKMAARELRASWRRLLFFFICVAVARAFVGRPKLLLADEPTGNLDGTTGKQVMDLLFELARADATTLILITHDLALAERCDRILRIADGIVVGDERTAVSLAAQ